MSDLAHLTERRPADSAQVERSVVLNNLIGSSANSLAARGPIGQAARMSNQDIEHQRQLRRLAVSVVLETLRTDEAVEFASALVAAGSESASALDLAMLPPCAKNLSLFEVEPMTRQMLSECGIVLPSESEAGWAMAGFLADAMIAGAIDPATGAFAIWRQWDISGEPGDELTGMLQLHDAWETSIGDQRAAIEAEMIDFAHTVRAAAGHRERS